MNFINGASAVVQNYWQEIPQGTAKSMVYEGGFVFVVCFVREPKIKEALIDGIIISLIIAVRALITPIFKDMVSPRPTLTWSEEMCRSWIPVFLVEPLSEIYLSRSIFMETPQVLLISVLAIGLFNYFNPHRRQLNHVGFLW